jgi:hypothetical protein
MMELDEGHFLNVLPMVNQEEGQDTPIERLLQKYR